MAKLLCTILAMLFSVLPYMALCQQLGVGVSMNAYNGDLSGYKKWTGMLLIGIKFDKKDKLHSSFNLGIGAINGQNIDFEFETQQIPPPSPKRFFKTNLISIHYQLQYNFVSKENLQIYAGQGIGICRFNPKDQFGEDLLDQPSTRMENETYGNLSIMLPTSVGCTYYLPNQFGVDFQVGFLNTLTDYIDNISELGRKNGNDNILFFRVSVLTRLRKKDTY